MKIAILILLIASCIFGFDVTINDIIKFRVFSIATLILFIIFAFVR